MSIIKINQVTDIINRPLQKIKTDNKFFSSVSVLDSDVACFSQPVKKNKDSFKRGFDREI